jgi:clan AA aspartic protease (TIGR02281 family)
MRLLRPLACLLPAALAMAQETINLPLERPLEGAAGTRVVDLGPGTKVTLENGKVRRLVMTGGGPAENGSERVRLAGKGSNEAPRELEGTATDLSALDRLRDRAAAAARATQRARAALPGLQAKERALQAQLTAKEKELQEAHPRLWRNRYNALAAEVNNLRGQVRQAADAAAAVERAEKAEAAALDAYLARAQKFSQDFAARKEAFFKHRARADAADYLERMEKRAARHLSALQRERPPAERVGDHLVFRAYAGEQGPVRLLLDTGATYVVMNRAAATRLGLPTEGQSTRLRVGNGELLEGKKIIAPTLRIGGSVAREVAVVVTAQPAAADGLDGVLGMSFLKQFQMRLDPTTGVLELGGPNLLSDSGTR